jgi:outer membrane protein assembly factor BamA
MRLVVPCSFAVLLLVAAPARTSAQDSSDGSPAPPALVDVGDLLRHVRHQDTSADDGYSAAPAKRFFVVAPTVTSKPSTGLTLGLSGNMAFVDGDPKTTHISSVSGGVRVTEKQQTLSGARLSMFTSDDRWYVQADGRMSWTSLNAYSLGGDAPSSSGENFKFDATRLYETAYRKIGRRLFIGAGLNISDHANIRPSSGSASTEGAFDAYSEANGFSETQQQSAGSNVALLIDTRDNSINADHGWLASTTYRTFYNGFLGGDSTWQELAVDVRTYRKLRPDGRQKLAFWMLGDFVTGGVAPYFDLPSTGGDLSGRMARGYTEGRFRGPQLMYGEIEYRNTLVPSGLVGFVAFLNTTTVGGEMTGEKLFQSFEPGTGLGLRLLLNKHSKTNLCVDYGWGVQQSRGLYLALQEAF